MQTKEIGNQLEDSPEELSNTRLLIACPNCGSRKLSHAGSVQRKAGKKQQYKCLECHVRFVEYFERKTKYWTDDKEIVCPNCSSRNCGAHGTRKTKAGNQQQYRCRECQAKFIGKYLRPRSSKYFQPNFVEIKIYCNYCSSSNYTKKGVGRNDKQRYQCKDCNRLFTFGSQPYNYVHHHFLDISDDVWDADQLGLRVNQHQKRRKLVFLYIQNVRSKAGLFRKALENNWQPDESDQERKINTIKSAFSLWYDIAYSYGIVIGYREDEGTIMVQENTGKWNNFDDFSAKWTLEYLKRWQSSNKKH